MLIEALCGVSKADLDKDYELTSYSKNFKSQQNTRKRLSNDWKNLLSYIKNNYEPYSESFRDQVIAFLI
jgi:mRNA-degrading endonuclease YafQ of YafQ-DinJ toxin-antitoxin module